MRRPVSLPEYLPDHFGVTAARLAGVSAARLRAADLSRPYFGARSAVAVGAEVSARCAAFAPVMSDTQFFSHVPAADLWGMPLPPWLHHGELHVSAPRGWREPRDKQILGHRLRVDPDHVVEHRSFRVSSPEETWAQLGGILDLPDLVATGDFAIGRGGLCDRDRLADAVRRVRRKGAADLRMALPLLHPLAESSPESRLRVSLWLQALPTPEVQWEVRDRERFIARLDLAYPEYLVAVEYDGRQHADAEQFRRDADRWYDLQSSGWVVVRVLAHHLLDGTAEARVRTALFRRGWRMT